MRQACLTLAAAEPERCAVIDAGLSPDAVLDKALGLVSERLGEPA